MKEIKGTVESIVEYLEGLNNNELMNAHNTKCEEYNDMDSQVFDNDEEFFEMFFDGRTQDLLRALQYGDHRYSDAYICFNGYANLDSFDSLALHVDLYEIANCILENESSFNVNLI